MSGWALTPPTSPRTAQRAANQDNLARSAKLARNLHSLMIALPFPRRDSRPGSDLDVITGLRWAAPSAAPARSGAFEPRGIKPVEPGHAGVGIGPVTGKRAQVTRRSNERGLAADFI